MIWKRQEQPRGADADVAQLAQTFDATSRHFARTLFWRNLGEASAGLVVAVVFTLVALRLKHVAWPVFLAVGLVLAVSGFFLWEMARARRMRARPDAPLPVKVAGDIAELRHQRRLLLSLRGWYLLPLAAAMVLFGVSVGLNDPMSAYLLKEPIVIGALATYAGLCAGLFGVVWMANRTAVRQRVEPRLAELEKLRDALSQK